MLTSVAQGSATTITGLDPGSTVYQAQIRLPNQLNSSDCSSAVKTAQPFDAGSARRSIRGAAATGAGLRPTDAGRNRTDSNSTKIYQLFDTGLRLEMGSVRPVSQQLLAGDVQTAPRSGARGIEVC